MYPPLLFVLALLSVFVVYLFAPRVLNKKYFYRYATFVLIVVAVNYAVKMVALFV